MIIQGDKIYLKKGLTEASYPIILKGFTDLEVMQYVCFARESLALKNIEELKEFIIEQEDGMIFGIYTRDNKFIGYTSLDSIKGKEECEFAIFILDKNYWGQGIGPEVTKLMLDYAFQELEMKKVILSTSEFHEKAIQIYERVGFQKSKFIPNDRTIYHNGQWLLSGTVEMEIYINERL